MNILYVEDSLTLVNMVKIFLEQKGIKVFATDNVDEAVDILNKEKIDFVLSDIILRGTIKTGYILVREMKKDDRFKNIPIMLTSTRDAKAATVTAKKVGARDFIEKPFGMEDLYQKIISIINENT